MIPNDFVKWHSGDLWIRKNGDIAKNKNCGFFRFQEIGDNDKQFFISKHEQMNGLHTVTRGTKHCQKSNTTYLIDIKNSWTYLEL
jgi:hypothetical protein